MNLALEPRELLDVPIGLIDDPELPSRTEMGDEEMDDLVRSIRAIGLQQPMILARVGARFEVIAGHRRLLACRRANLAVAPAIVYRSKNAAQVAIQYAENRFREELNPADEAILFGELLERDCGGDVDTLAAKLGEKRGYIEGRLILLRDPEILDALRGDKPIRIGVALQLLKITDPTMRRYYLDAARRGGATVTVAAAWVQEWQNYHRDQHVDPAAVVEAAPPGPAPAVDYFRCVVCGKNDNVHLMQPFNVHSHCKLAILDELLASYRGER
jgi:ParB family chromosome partitioning protein